MQIYATWIFYAVLNDLSADVAVALQQPLERISVEMVFRSLYFFHRARSHNSQLQLIPWLVEHQRSMGLVKAVRQRHRRNAARSLDIWADALTSHQWHPARPTRALIILWSGFLARPFNYVDLLNSFL